MKIAILGAEKWEINYLKDNLKKHRIIHSSEKHLNPRNLNKIKDAEALIVFIYSKINEEVLKKLPKLKIIATMSTGFDHIELKACQKRKIRVYNVPSYGSRTVAEHTFALILSLAKNLVESVERTRRSDFNLDGLRGMDLYGKTMGVIGVGKIGENVVKIANGFGMRVLGYKHTRDRKHEKELSYKYVSLEEILKKSDIISLHAPLTKETEFMINMNNIKKIKKGALLINTARGNLVDSRAIAYAIDKGILAGAGLDVLENECGIMEEKEILKEDFRRKCDLTSIIENHVLIKYDNVIITPHNAFNTREALQRILDTTVENIEKGPKSNKVA